MPMWLFDFIDEIFMPNPEQDDRKRHTKRLALALALAVIVGTIFA